MPDVVFRKPTDADIAYLAANMREADRLECEAIGFDAKRAAEDSVRISDVCWAVLFNGEVAGIFGRTPEHSEGRTVAGRERAVTVWLLTTPVVDAHPFTFLRLSRPVLRRLLEGVDTAINVVDSRYRSCLRWAQWLGFEVLEPIALGGARPDFIPVRVRGT